MALAKGKKKETKKEEKKFVEFNFKSESFDFSGRVYPGEIKSSKNGNAYRRSYMSLCINGLITIQGCNLVETDSSTFISLPGYQTKEGEDKSYFFIDKDFRDEFNNLAACISDLLPNE